MSTLEELLHHAGHELSEAKAKHNLHIDCIFNLLCDADDALSILDTNPDALKVAHKRIKQAIKYTRFKTTEA
jgi:hypothetical protein